MEFGWVRNGGEGRSLAGGCKSREDDVAGEGAKVHFDDLNCKIVRWVGKEKTKNPNSTRCCRYALIVTSASNRSHRGSAGSLQSNLIY